MVFAMLVVPLLSTPPPVLAAELSATVLLIEVIAPVSLMPPPICARIISDRAVNE